MSQKLVSVAAGIRLLRRLPLTATQSTLHWTPMALLAGGKSIVGWTHVTYVDGFYLGLAQKGPIGKGPATRCLPTGPNPRPGSRVRLGDPPTRVDYSLLFLIMEPLIAFCLALT